MSSEPNLENLLKAIIETTDTPDKNILEKYIRSRESLPQHLRDQGGENLAKVVSKYPEASKLVFRKRLFYWAKRTAIASIAAGAIALGAWGLMPANQDVVQKEVLQKETNHKIVYCMESTLHIANPDTLLSKNQLEGSYTIPEVSKITKVLWSPDGNKIFGIDEKNNRSEAFIFHRKDSLVQRWDGDVQTSKGIAGINDTISNAYWNGDNIYIKINESWYELCANSSEKTQLCARPNTDLAILVPPSQNENVMLGKKKGEPNISYIFMKNKEDRMIGTNIRADAVAYYSPKK